jgi:PAS domain S-box-containing protein
MTSDDATATLYRAICEATADAIIFADRAGRIGLWNRGAELIFGHAAADVMGQSLDIIIPERLRAAHWEAFHRSLQTGLTKYTDRVLTTRAVHKDGTKRYVDLGFGLVRDASGAIAGAFAVGRDCTARHAAETALRARVQELETRLAAVTPTT